MLNKHIPLALTALTVALLTACGGQQATKQTPITVVQGKPSATPAPTQPVVQPTPVQVMPAPQPAPQPPVVPTKPMVDVPDEVRHYSSFGAWKSDFIQRAIAKGYDASLVEQLMSAASLNQRVIDLDKSQAEFTKMPWEYVNSAVTSGRVNQAQAKLSENQSVLNAAQARYGVPREVVTAIWGVESSFGAGTGSMDLVNALSSLAYDGRRREFAENQLLSMIEMTKRGDASLSQFKGSWAGGMGHTQFIPSTWIAQAVDGNQDGRRNPWHAADALHSTASYLKNSGWQTGLSPFYEVRLPSGFNHQLIGQKQSLDAWKQQGLTTADGVYFGGTALAELWLPAGINGPALLLTPNFDVIKVYNNSSSYALAVALLAKRTAGGSGIVSSWPTHEQPLSRTQTQTLQRNLTAQGYDTKGVDGVAGANTRTAFARWQAAKGLIPDGFISQNSARALLY